MCEKILQYLQYRGLLLHYFFDKKNKNKMCFVKHECPLNSNFLENGDLDIWPWQMTLALVLKKGFYSKKYIS